MTPPTYKGEAAARALIASGDWIAAVKHLRKTDNLSLMDAKQIVDDWRNDLPRPSWDATMAARIIMPSLAVLERTIQDAINAGITKATNCLFATMPEPPSDMGDLVELQAYADAIAQWRANNGHPLRYDGPVGG